MGVPAVKERKQAAGKLTKKAFIALSTAIVFLTICIFSTASEAHAQYPRIRSARTITVAQKLPFGTSYIDLPDKYRGYENLITEGVMGEREISAQVVYEGDRPVHVMSISSTQTAQPVNQIVERGTMELRSETYDGSEWKTSFIRPVKIGWVSAPLDDYPGHTGVDFAAPRGTPVYASAEGTVILSRWYGEYGYCVILQHDDGTQTLYAHNSQLLVYPGQRVRQGEMISRIGSTGNSTGNHLHFEIRRDGEYLDALIYINK